MTWYFVSVHKKNIFLIKAEYMRLFTSHIQGLVLIECLPRFSGPGVNATVFAYFYSRGYFTCLVLIRGVSLLSSAVVRVSAV